jgi:ribosomal protein S18 acetylase RimI-like enzyme
MSTTTREAIPSDAPAISELFDLYRQFYEQEPNRQLALEFITERLSKQESVILVAENPQSGLIGFCQLYPTFCSVEAKPIYSLYDLFVVPSARKSGVAKLLLQAAEAKAANAGKVRMDLTTAKTNTAAQSLYESLGWIRDDVFLAYNRKIVQP